MQALKQRYGMDKEAKFKEAAKIYFKLFVKDWADKRKMRTELQSELQNMLEDFAFFMEDYLFGSEETSRIEDDQKLELRSLMRLESKNMKL